MTAKTIVTATDVAIDTITVAIAKRPTKAALGLVRLARTPIARRMLDDMAPVGFGERTQESYLRAVSKLADYYHISPDQLLEEQVRAYFLMLRIVKKYVPGSLKVAYCGVRFFYTHTVPRDWATLKQLRIPKQRKLPAVLSIAEVQRLIATIEQPRQRAL